MTAHAQAATLATVAEARLQTLVLQEFRLSAVDADGAVARIVDGAAHGLEPAVPLLTSIDDHRDVATIRGVRDGEATEDHGTPRAALDAFLSSWEPAKYYLPRIAERSHDPPTYYRLAVTESGIEDERGAPADANAFGTNAEGGWAALDLLWVGRPSAAHSGLLVLLGNHDDADVPRSDPQQWPLPMSRQLGVRIYESGR